MRSLLREAIEALAIAVFLTFLFQSVGQVYQVHGWSMEPTLLHADRVVLNKAAYLRIDAEPTARLLPWLEAEPGAAWEPFGGPKRGDVVVFAYPNDPSQAFVKRVIGEPGDSVRFEDGVIYLNGVPLEEGYVEYGSHETLAEITVGEGEYFVVGDNRPESSDSRAWGTVSREAIIGKTWVTYWPPERFGTLTYPIVPPW
ncbi:MAG: signal peptidase I [Chloroflexota bacterium]|nr:signal peptidase I [Chloroflexota bacterium]